MTQQPRTPTPDPLVEAWRRWTESLTDPGRPTTGMLVRDAFAAGWDSARADLSTQIEKAVLGIAPTPTSRTYYEEGWIDAREKLLAAIRSAAPVEAPHDPR